MLAILIDNKTIN